MTREQGLPEFGQHAHGNAGAPTLLVFTEHFNATYTISFELPLKHLHAGGRVNFSAYSQNDVRRAGEGCWEAWIYRCRPATVVLTRYGRPDGVRILRYCQSRGIPVVYHIDDDLLDLPASLGQEVLQRHMAPEIVEARRAMLAGCDVIYASTARLAHVLQERFPGQKIFHGIYAPYVESRAQPPGADRALTIGYMGSRGHREDLALAVPAIERLLQERPELRFETFGTIEMPPELAAFGDRVRHHPGHTEYGDFLRHLARLDWHVGLAPLVDEPFNRCKAPTKFVEYTGAAIPTVASPTVYADAIPAGAGTIVRSDWYTTLREVLDDPKGRADSLAAARAHCGSAYALDALARQVLHVTTRMTPSYVARKLLTLARRAGGWVRRQPGRALARAYGPVQRGGKPGHRALRILYVANSFLPTLQLCFVRPLQPLAEAGEIAWEVLADNQLHRAGTLLSGGRGRWTRRRIEAFRPDVVVFCRYSGPQARQLVEWARAHGVATLLHLDDDLLNVPPEIGAAKHAFHNRPERLAAVRYLLERVDLVYCSTRVLLERMQGHGLDARRGLAARIHCPGEVLRAPPQEGPLTIGYMGIDHAHDFEVALPALVRVLERNPQVRFALFGSIPKPAVLEAFGDRVTVVPLVKSYDEFLHRFASLGWAIGICPLADTSFNRTKANNKWVEYTAVGAAVVATRGMLYDECCADGCGMLAAGEADWEQALQQLIDDPSARLAMVAAAQRRLREEYSAERLRGQLLEVFRLAQARAQSLQAPAVGGQALPNS